MSVLLASDGIQLLDFSGICPERVLYNDVIVSITKNNVVKLKDVLEKGLKQRGVKGCNAIKQLLNSIKFSPPKSVRGMGELGDHGGPDPAVSLPLMVSCMFAYDDCTAVLLEYGADPNVADESGIFPLVLAVSAYNSGRAGSPRAFQLLLQHGASVDLTTTWHHGKTALQWACQHASPDVVKLLLLHGADVNKKMPDGYTALHIAARSNRVEIMKMLLNKKAEVNAQEKEGFTCLHEAAGYNFPDVIKCLLQRGAAVDLPSKSVPSDPLSSGATALFIAARCNHIESVKVLLEGGADAFKPNMMGATPFWIAKSSGFCACAQLLESSKNARPVAQEPEVQSSPELDADGLKSKLDADGLKSKLDADGLKMLSAKQLKAMLRKMDLQCPSGLEKSELAEYVLEHTRRRIPKEQMCTKASTSEASRPSSSSAAAQLGSSSASSAAACPDPPSTVADKSAHASCNLVPVEGSKGGPAELQAPSGAAEKPPGPRPAVKACLWCGASGKRLKCCSGCGTVWLCGKDCQQQSWPSHRAACKEAQKKARVKQRGESKQDS